MGFSALAIADRVGHESIDITYRYAHLFPNKQTEMANQLDRERKAETLPPEELAVSKNYAAERSADSQVKKERTGYDG